MLYRAYLFFASQRLSSQILMLIHKPTYWTGAVYPDQALKDQIPDLFVPAEPPLITAAQTHQISEVRLSTSPPAVKPIFYRATHQTHPPNTPIKL
jgi:hypothetical protein